MTISNERKQFIRNMSNDEWGDYLEVDDAELNRISIDMKRKTKEFLRTTANPLELHYFVDNYNWDKEYEESNIVEVLRNTHCDLSTIRMIFWLASPSYYQKFANRDEVDNWAKDLWDIIMEIIEMVNSGKYGEATIAYDPFERDASELDPSLAKWSIPSVLKEACISDRSP